MLHEHIEFLKTALVQQQIKSFSGCELAFGVLGIDPLLSATNSGRLAALNKLLDFLKLYIIHIQLFILEQTRVLLCNIDFL